MLWMLRISRSRDQVASNWTALSTALGINVRRHTQQRSLSKHSMPGTLDFGMPTSEIQVSGNAKAAVTALAISEQDDDQDIRTRYRPFLLDTASPDEDWVAQIELRTITGMVQRDMAEGSHRMKVLVLYGSLRQRSYSRLLAFEAARILFRLGCDARIYDPTGLPVKDDTGDTHHKVQELRALSLWSEGHIWVSPEQHGNLTAVFKNQIDWIPLSTGSVRPTQGRTLAIAQVSGGSQSFNSVNSLRILGRWMRMFTIPNQASVPMAYKQFSGQDGGNERHGRMIPGSNRDRLVDVIEEFVKYTLLIRPHAKLFDDRYSERMSRRQENLEETTLTENPRGAMNGQKHGQTAITNGKYYNQEVGAESRNTVNGINLLKI